MQPIEGIAAQPISDLVSQLGTLPTTLPVLTSLQDALKHIPIPIRFTPVTTPLIRGGVTFGYVVTSGGQPAPTGATVKLGSGTLWFNAAMLGAPFASNTGLVGVPFASATLQTTGTVTFAASGVTLGATATLAIAMTPPRHSGDGAGRGRHRQGLPVRHPHALRRSDGHLCSFDGGRDGDDPADRAGVRPALRPDGDAHAGGRTGHAPAAPDAVRGRALHTVGRRRSRRRGQPRPSSPWAVRRRWSRVGCCSRSSLSGRRRRARCPIRWRPGVWRSDSRPGSRSNWPTSPLRCDWPAPSSPSRPPAWWA